MKEKKIVHIETRKTSSGKFQLYLEIESKSSEDWNNITRWQIPKLLLKHFMWRVCVQDQIKGLVGKKNYHALLLSYFVFRKPISTHLWPS